MKIAVLAGDGVGPEVTAQAVKVLRATVGDANLQLTEAPVGGAGVAAAGVAASSMGVVGDGPQPASAAEASRLEPAPARRSRRVIIATPA